jgi:hypothetical protein
MAELIPSDAVKAIQASVDVQRVEVDGLIYTSKPVYLPPDEPSVTPITVHTLTGLVDYLRADLDEVQHAVQIHVVGPTLVRLVTSPEGRGRDRSSYLVADCKPIIGGGYSFGQFRPSENFIIDLMSLFERTEAIANILAVVGNVREESVRSSSDDGITQTVTARQGIARVTNVEVPNPVILRPYRTFPEVGQPESAFVLRLKSGKDGELPSCALFEADGGRWKLDAIYNIRQYLAEALPEATILA